MMTQRLLGACLAIAVLAPWSMTSLTAPAAIPQGNGQNTNPAFAQRVTGTWIEFDPPYSILMNIRGDGTMDWFGSWFFGNGTRDFYDGPVYGSWRQTGPRELTTVEVGHLFNGDGSFFATGRVRQVFAFSPDLQTITGIRWEEDLFDPYQDPTDPNAIPFDSFSGTGGPMRRLQHRN